MLWQRFTRSYDRAIWIRIAGTALTTVTTFMIRPFLVLYLFGQLEGSVLLPLFIVGLQPLAAMVTGWWGGGLSDRYGRKPLMVLALIANIVAMVGYAVSGALWHYALFSILNGIGHSLFQPAANAQIADIVPEEKRAEVFAALHTAFNVGAAFGPAIGLMAFTWQPKLVFAASAIAFVGYLLLVLRFIPETLPVRLGGDGLAGATEGAAASAPAAPSERLTFGKHRLLFAMTGLALAVSILYSQVETVLPLHLQEHFDSYQAILTAMLTLNGLTVMLLQIPIARWTEQWPVQRVVLLSYGLLAVVSLLYGFAPWFALLLAAELVFSLGEMLLGPHMQKAVSQIAPVSMRGRYFSVYGMNYQLSRAFGPVAFGFLFQHYGGRFTFSLIAVLLVFSGIGQFLLVRRLFQRTASATAVEGSNAATSG